MMSFLEEKMSFKIDEEKAKKATKGFLVNITM
jgi:hypothetical protein